MFEQHCDELGWNAHSLRLLPSCDSALCCLRAGAMGDKLPEGLLLAHSFPSVLTAHRASFFLAAPAGAMDDKLLEFLQAEEVPTFSMSSGLTLDDFGWGSPTFHKMVRLYCRRIAAVPLPLYCCCWWWCWWWWCCCTAAAAGLLLPWCGSSAAALCYRQHAHLSAFANVSFPNAARLRRPPPLYWTTTSATVMQAPTE